MSPLQVASAATLLAFAAPLALAMIATQPASGPKGAIPLPPPDKAGRMPVEKTLLKRRSVRTFSARPLPLAAVSQLLWAAQGITAADGGRTAPSAGGLWPLEVHLVATRVEGLEPGLYRYSPSTHSLLSTASGPMAPPLAKVSLDQDFIAEAAAVVLIAAVEGRTSRKYGSRAPRYVAFEAGAAAENLALQAVAVGLGTVVVGAFDDDSLAKLARLRAGERPLCLMPVGYPAAN
ncbi:MAG: SagB/ThcOx family dehydrogenase [Acidithiobacillales bacterium]